MKARHYLLTTAALLIAGTAHARSRPRLRIRQRTIPRRPTPRRRPIRVRTSSSPVSPKGAIASTRRSRSARSTPISPRRSRRATPPKSCATCRRRVEASGGEGNANISVRGLPVASGGSKFLQLQEDGLPVLEFGDIIFGNADIFIRNDLSLARIESVRGGSARPSPATRRAASSTSSRRRARRTAARSSCRAASTIANIAPTSPMAAISTPTPAMK